MSTTKLSNISIATFERFLSFVGCIEVPSGNTGHKKWVRKNCSRPVIHQTHIEPIPEFIIGNNLRNIGCTKSQLRAWLVAQSKKG